MILFSIITLVTLIWTLQLANKVRVIGNTADTLEADIKGAVESCGVSLN